MILYLATPQKTFSISDLQSITLQTLHGETMILPAHARLLGRVEPGLLLCRSSSEVKSFQLKQGFFEVNGERVTLLCEEAQPLQGSDSVPSVFH